MNISVFGSIKITGNVMSPNPNSNRLRFGRRWTQVATVVQNKDAIKCMNYFNNNLKLLESIKGSKLSSASVADANRSKPWSEQEKSLLLTGLALHGRNWKVLTSCVPTRTENQIKNYYQNYKGRLGFFSFCFSL